MEGLYYVRAARTALGLDPGPELAPLPGQRHAGAVTEDREVTVAGQEFAASPEPSPRTRHYFPGGTVAGRPVPAGWYNQPWWKTALIGGAWGLGSIMIFDALFSGMPGLGDFGGGDFGGGDFGGGDFGGDDFADFGSGDFGGFGGFGE